jgi:hypothetical protein
MKVRFLKSDPLVTIKDKIGIFSVACVSNDARTPFPEEFSIIASPGVGNYRSAVDLCNATFPSALEGLEAMQRGIEIAANHQAEDFANRCVAAGRAELVE